MRALAIFLCAAPAMQSCGIGCESIDGRNVGSSICLIADDGGERTDDSELLAIVDLFGSEEMPRINVRIEPADIDCGYLSHTGYCSGLYYTPNYIMFVRREHQDCLATTAFAHEWAHAIMDYQGLDFSDNNDSEWFRPDGIVSSVNRRYALEYCNVE